MTTLIATLAHPRALPGLLLGALPSALKYTAVLLVLINIGSFPFMWHLRVFAPALRLRFIYLVLRVRLLFKSKKVREARVQAWLDTLSPIGISPFALRPVHTAWATPDDCDYNMHLSNSCYPKVLDQARLKAALQMCPAFFQHGGWMALGATHHHFIREIPIFARYEARMSIGAWDQKWIYIVVRFVTHPKGGRSKRASASIAAPEKSSSLPSLHTPSTPLDISDASGATTPVRSTGADGASSDPGAALPALARAHAAQPEPDGATLHCIAVSVMCFKHGRMTVPPAVVLAAEGMHAPAPAGAAAYSRANPPPTWGAHAQALRAQKNAKGYKAWVRGGWKEDRWWEAAMGGEVEEERKRKLGEVEGLRRGVEGARGCF